jgi:hypothetical protein
MQPPSAPVSYFEVICGGVRRSRQTFLDVRLTLSFRIKPDQVLGTTEQTFATVHFGRGGARILLTFFHVSSGPAAEMIEALAEIQTRGVVGGIDVSLVHCTDLGRSRLFPDLVALRFAFRQDGLWLGWRGPQGQPEKPGF